MPFTLTMPKLSPTMEEGVIVKWHKKEGDFVESGEVLFEVATDKATVEYNALDGGWLRTILIPDGKEARVNQAVAVFSEDQNEDVANYKPEGNAPAEPVVAETKEEAKEPTGEPSEVQPSKKAAVAQPSFVPEQPPAQASSKSPSVRSKSRIFASPLARKLAEERHLDLTSLVGSGPGGRVMSRDLERARPVGKYAFGRSTLPQIQAGTFEEETMMPMRKIIAQRLQEAKSFIPHFYVQLTIDPQPMLELREQLKTVGLKISVNDCMIRACALALRDHPIVNSGFNSVNNTIVRFKTIDISVAVSVDEGLITPIIRHADYKNLGEISQEVKELAKRAKEGKLEAYEYKGGSFTISNLGMYGVSDFQAIINPPQAAILAISGILDVPVIKNGAIVPGKTMNITLSADHRVIDGVAGASFLKSLQKIIENPVSLLL